MILVGLHAGTHWRKPLGAILKSAGPGRYPLLWKMLHAVSFTIAIYGLWAFGERDMGAKLFQGFAYDFWDPEKPQFLFYTHNIAILWVFAYAANIFLKLAGALGHPAARPGLAAHVWRMLIH